MPKKIKPIFSAGLLFLAFFSISRPVYAQSTTYYFSPTYEKTDGVVTKHYALPGGAMAVRKNGELSYLHQDHLGSTRLMTNDQGLMINEYDYYPYGQITVPFRSLGEGGTDKLYTSQILDPSTNLYFYNARQYNPLTGAFISADVAQGPNRYAYVLGNPISRNDPNGNAYEAGSGSGGGVVTRGDWKTNIGYFMEQPKPDWEMIGESFRFLGYNVLGGAGLYPILAGAEALTGIDIVSGEKLTGGARIGRALGAGLGAAGDYFLGPVSYGNAPSSLAKEYSWAHSTGYYKQAASDIGAENAVKTGLPHVGPKSQFWGRDFSQVEYNLGNSAESAAHEFHHLQTSNYLSNIGSEIGYSDPSVQTMGYNFTRLEEIAACRAGAYASLIQGDIYGQINSLGYASYWSSGGGVAGYLGTFAKYLTGSFAGFATTGTIYNSYTNPNSYR